MCFCRMSDRTGIMAWEIRCRSVIPDQKNIGYSRLYQIYSVYFVFSVFRKLMHFGSFIQQKLLTYIFCVNTKNQKLK
jgi:hypothetical protein